MTRTLLIELSLGAGVGVTWHFLQPSTAKDEAPTGRCFEVKTGELIETAAATGIVEPHAQGDVKSRTSGEVAHLG